MIQRSIPLLLTLALLGGGALGNPPLQIPSPRGMSSRLGEAESQVPRVRSSITAEGDYMLPTSVVPFYYTLSLRPILYAANANSDERENTAPGTVAIQVACQTATSEIVLHKGSTLNITNVAVSGGPDNANIPVSSHEYANETQYFYRIALSSPLAVGQNYTVTINFVTSISTTTTHGLYRALYTNDAGEQKRLATTQFESAGARDAFPCFDEPNLRAKFKISLGRPANAAQFTALSNTDVEQADVVDPATPNWVWDEFRETVSMPTYLLAFIVAEDYGFTQADSTLFDKPVRVYGPAHQMSAPRSGGVFPAEQSAKLLKYLQDTYQFPYEMPKLDSIAIPTNYFGGGAMENWGLNTYRENYLLFFNGESGEANKQSIGSILTHELTHQWFGNLLTCKWWTQIWLNEGFATYISFYGVREVLPQFDYVREMLWDSVQYAMAYDVGRSDSVVNNAYSPEQIENVFGTLTYDKAGSLIRMIGGFLGEDTLNKALVAYLTKHNYSGVESDDLFTVLTETALADGKIQEGTDIKRIMETWTHQPGYPLIRVSQVGNSLVFISQERFMTQPREGSSESRPEDSRSTLWEVPIATAVEGDSWGTFANYTPKLWLSQNALSVAHPHESSKWLVVNPDGIGFYRVLYDEELTMKIKGVLDGSNHELIGALSRSQILDDYFNLAKQRYIKIDQALDLTTYLNKEEDHVVWYSVFTALTKPLAMFSNENQSAFRAYWLSKIEPALGRLGWRQEPDDAGTPVLLRAKLLDWACTLMSSSCISNAQEIFREWRENQNESPLVVDIQPVYYCAIVAHGGEDAYEFVIQKILDSATSAFQRTRLITAISCATDTVVIDNLLERTLSNATVFVQNAATIIRNVAANSAGRKRALDFVKDNFDRLRESLRGNSAFTEVINTLSTYVTRESDVNAVEEFIKVRESDFSEAESRTLASNVAAMRANIEWVDEFYEPMNAWFERQQSSP